jgi:uncharacterized membrane protein YgcG
LLAAAAALGLALLGPTVGAAAIVPTDTSDFSFDSFDGQYHLGLDAGGHATTRIVETLVARFPDIDQNRGIIRYLPLNYGEAPLEVSVLSVKDENGDPVYYERADYDGFAEIALGTDEFVHGLVTYVIEYTVKNSIRHFADSGVPETGIDEFYWDINGNGWAQTFGSVSARVFVPPELTSRLTGDAACYLGYYGSTDQCVIEHNEAGTRFAASVGLVGPYNTLTISIGFEGGTVVQPELPRDSWIVQLAPKVLLGILALLVAIAIVIKTAVWRDKPGRGTIIAQFEPPDDLNMLLAANLVGRTSSGLPALFVDLAVRGNIKIIDNEPGAQVGDDNRFSLELVTADGVKGQELRVLVILFGASLAGGKRVNPGTLSESIGASLYGLPALTAAATVKEGLRFEPASKAPKFLTRISFWTVIAFVPIWVWATIFDVLGGNVVWPTIGTIVLAIALPIVLSKPKRLSGRGALAKEYLLGMREYLTIAEEDRMRVLQSPQGADRIDVTDTDAVVKLNERLLGYAVLWGVEDQWVEQLRAAYPSGTPSWLEGNSLNSSMFHSFTSTSVSSVRPIVTASSSSGSSWSSSGSSSFSSGSSGGGFSGGGGGGGGGGGR